MPGTNGVQKTIDLKSLKLDCDEEFELTLLTVVKDWVDCSRDRFLDRVSEVDCEVHCKCCKIHLNNYVINLTIISHKLDSFMKGYMKSWTAQKLMDEVVNSQSLIKVEHAEGEQKCVCCAGCFIHVHQFNQLLEQGLLKCWECILEHRSFEKKMNQRLFDRMMTQSDVKIPEPIEYTANLVLDSSDSDDDLYDCRLFSNSHLFGDVENVILDYDYDKSNFDEDFFGNNKN